MPFCFEAGPQELRTEKNVRRKGMESTTPRRPIFRHSPFCLLVSFGDRFLVPRTLFKAQSARHSPTVSRPSSVMGDDVDGLLDELDGMLKEEKPSANNERVGSSYGGTAKTGSSSSGCSGFGRVTVAKPVADKGVGRATAAKPAVDGDIDSLLADLDSSPQRAAKQTRALPADAARNVVSSVSIGVAARSSSSSSETSTNLRCSSCDFRVLRFLDSEWKSDVDYMFFRNFMPNEAKLRPLLKASDGRCAFSCQCSWASIELGERVPNPKWFPSR